MSNLLAYLEFFDLDLKASEVTFLLKANTLELSNFCNEYGCDPTFFKALFSDNFPDLLDLIVLDEQTELMVRDYAPDLFKKYGEEAFWEMLYVELISLNEHDRARFELHINKEEEDEDEMYYNEVSAIDESLVMNYPFIMVFFGKKLESLQLAIIYYDVTEYVQYITEILESETKFKYAIKYNSYNIILLFLTHGVIDPSAEDNQAILFASEEGYTNIVKLLSADPRVFELTQRQAQNSSPSQVQPLSNILTQRRRRR